MVRAAVHHSKSLPMLFVMWAILSFCLVVGLLSAAIERVAANDFRIANVDLIDLAGPATTSPGDGVDRELAGVAAEQIPVVDWPSVRYAGTSWSITGARLIPRAEQETGRPIVVVEVVVRNVTGDTATRSRIADISLVWPNGDREPADRFEFADDPDVLTLAPGAVEVVTLVFKPSVEQDPELGSLVVEVGETGRVPARIPLIGPVPDPVYPAVGTIDGPDDDPSIRIDRVIVDVDAGPYRAALGRRLVIIDVEVAADVGLNLLERIADRDEGGHWAIEVDGESSGPERIEVDPVDPDDPETSRSVTIIFVVDDGATEAVLVSGADRREPIRFELDLPNPLR